MVKSYCVCVCGGGKGIYVYTLDNYGNKKNSSELGKYLFIQWRKEEELILNKEVANEIEDILKKAKIWAKNVTA